MSEGQSELRNQLQQKELTQIEQVKQQIEKLEYIEPFWSSKPIYDFYFEVMKDGAIMEEIDLTKKSFFLVGRQQDICDIYLENPTISRKHAVIQHKDTGDIFVYDMGSTHGTFVNKKLIPQSQYIKLQIGDMIKFGQSTRWFILNGPEDLLNQSTEEDNQQPHKKIQIVSKKQNQEFLFKKRVDQIKMFSESLNQLKSERLQKIHGDADGASWGMDNDEEEIAAYQKRMDEENDDDEDSESREGDSDEEDDNELLNIEEIKQREDLTEKQRSMINKIEGIRRKLKKILDKRASLRTEEELEFDESKIKGKLKGIDKKAHEMKELLEKEEGKLRTSMKSKKREKKQKKEEDEGLFKYKNSDDEEDEFFDRTKFHKFNNATKQEQNLEAGIETYETIKSKLEALYKQRQKLTEDMQNRDLQQSSQKQKNEEEDEFEAFIKQNEDQLKLDQQRQFGQQIASIQKDIDKYTRLIALVAPSTFSNKAQAIQGATVQIESPQKEQIESDKATTQTSSKHHHQQKNSIQSTLQKLKEMSELKEKEQEMQQKKEEEELRAFHQKQMELHITAFEENQRLKNEEQEQEEGEGYDQGHVDLEADSGLRNYFKEIVANANKYGDKIDMSQYKNLLNEYDVVKNKRIQNNTEDLESDVRGSANSNKRAKNYGVKETKNRNEVNDLEEERIAGEVDDWIPPTDQVGDGKTSLNAKFGY